jgi:transposase
MAMGKRRRRPKQASMWVATQDLPRTAAHPFYTRLNQILDHADFDGYVEAVCQRFYADEVGRPGLPPGRYFRLLLIGYFEGLDAERAIAWRAADSFALREFLGLVLPDAAPDHSTISRTRRLIDLETHEAVFTWMLQRLADAGLVKGKTVGIDATTLEANAALRSIVRRDTGESYQDFLTKLAQASGIETPTRADLARIDRRAASAPIAPPTRNNVPGSGTGCACTKSYSISEPREKERPVGLTSSARPMKLADALPLPVSSTVKMGGALDGLVTGLSRNPFITAVKLNGTSTSDRPSSVSVTAGVVIVPELNATKVSGYVMPSMTPMIAPSENPAELSVAPRSTRGVGTKPPSTHGVHEPILARNPPMGVLTTESSGPSTPMASCEALGWPEILPDEITIGSAWATVGEARNHSDTATAHMKRRTGIIMAPPGASPPVMRRAEAKLTPLARGAIRVTPPLAFQRTVPFVSGAAVLEPGRLNHVRAPLSRPSGSG